MSVAQKVVVGLVVVVAFGAFFKAALEIAQGPDRVDRVRAECEYHGGVSRLDDGIVVCRDGYVGDYR